MCRSKTYKNQVRRFSPKYNNFGQIVVSMMESREINVEDAGSIVILNIEETANESTTASIAKEGSSQEKTNRCVTERTVVWKIFKKFLFLACFTILIIQSVEFLNIYYKYPTNIVTETTLSQDFKLPAVTLCFRNT
ncbi:hypothetical protein AVEN_798-1 [Araneus ventricosus]|uniref:Uncharacterized protein n=1 Tax=Araneus ventricosus TaxID=182803 RepID=A0A4Y2MPB5_ARAVE|nr:hypothetical protein AVEN_798-1 [Araneus ventricosus]